MRPVKHLLFAFLALVYTGAFGQLTQSQITDRQLRNNINGGPGLSDVNFKQEMKNKLDGQVAALSAPSQFSLTTTTENQYQYDGSVWVKASGSITSSAPGFGFARLPGPGGTHYVRQLVNGWVEARWVLTGDSLANNNTNINKALDYAIYASPKAPKLLLPHGTWSWTQLGVYVPNVTIEGDFRGTKVRKTTSRGIAFDVYANNFTLQGVTIDAGASTLDGGVWVSGRNIKIRYVKVIDPDAIGIVVSGVWSNGTAFVPVSTDNVLVEHCEVTRQKRYHDIGAPAPFLAGGSATGVIFRHCRSIDNNADAFDSDNATTIFEYCEAIKTGGQSTYAGFWMEGGESATRATVRHCRVTNFALGFGSSELAQLEIEDSYARQCQRAIDTPSGNSFPLLARNVQAVKCGNGLEASDINGVFRLTGPGTLENCRSDSSYARWDVVNYSVTGTATTLTVNGGTYKSIMAAYENGGNENVFITNVQMPAGQIRWQCSGTPTRRVYINGGRVASISGARILDAVVDGVTMLGSGSGTAIELSGGAWYNTKVINSKFESYSYVHANAGLGYGNSWSVITNPPVKVEDVVVKGTDPTRSGYYGNITDEVTSGYWAAPAAASGLPFSNGYPWMRNVMHESNGNSQMYNPAGWWHMEYTYNIHEGSMFWRRKHATNGFETWRELLDKINFPVSFSSPATGAVLIYNGTNWINSPVRIFYGTGSPEGVVSAPVSSHYFRTDGGAGTSFYVKESGTGNTGWTAK